MSINKPTKQAGLTREQIESAARETLAFPPNDEGLRDIIDGSLSLSDSLESITREQLRLGQRFAEVMTMVTKAFVTNYGESSRTRREAEKTALDHLARLHGISASTVRLYIAAYQKFHARPEAISFLRLTDMQLLLGKDISDEIVNAVIEQRRADLAMSTREVKSLISRMRLTGSGTDAQAPTPRAP